MINFGEINALNLDNLNDGDDYKKISSAKEAQIHEKNTDTKLDEGGENEITAEQIKQIGINEQYVLETLITDAEWNITHKEDSLYNRNIQVFRDLLNTDVSLDFDGIDEGSFIQEDSGKTDFIEDKLQLQNLGLEVYAHYHLNEFSGINVPDSSGNERNGTCVNMEDEDWVQGKLNNCLSFNGTNQYVNLGDIANFERTDPFSIECWFKTTYDGRRLVTKINHDSPYTGWELYMNSTKLGFQLTSSNDGIIVIGNTTNLNNEAWHHAIVTYDGSSSASGVHLYVDNNLETLTVVKDTLSASTINSIDCEIGAKDGANSCFKDLIDEVLIYDKELNSTEVSYRYNLGNGREDLGGFDISKGWYVLTNTNQLITSTWKSITGLNFTQNTPANTQLKYLVSIDARTSWKKWVIDHWETEILDNLHTNGNTKDELEALTEANWDLLFSPGTLDIAIGLKTTDGEVTPDIDQITVNYKLIGKQKCKDSEIEVITINSTQTRVKNISGDSLYNLRAVLDF